MKCCGKREGGEEIRKEQERKRRRVKAWWSNPRLAAWGEVGSGGCYFQPHVPGDVEDELGMKDREDARPSSKNDLSLISTNKEV